MHAAHASSPPGTTARSPVATRARPPATANTGAGKAVAYRARFERCLTIRRRRARACRPPERFGAARDVRPARASTARRQVLTAAPRPRAARRGTRRLVSSRAAWKSGDPLAGHGRPSRDATSTATAAPGRSRAVLRRPHAEPTTSRSRPSMRRFGALDGRRAGRSTKVIVELDGRRCHDPDPRFESDRGRDARLAAAASASEVHVKRLARRSRCAARPSLWAALSSEAA